MNYITSLLNWKSKPLTNLQTITGCAMLCALYVALKMFTISLTPTLRISFAFVALALSCALYGFWPNMILCVAADFLGYLVHPDGPYVPMFAAILMVRAFIYVLFFYRQKEIPVWKILAAQALTVIICNILLNPLLLQMMYGTPYWMLASGRLLKSLIMYPIECALLYLAFRAARGIPAFKRQ